MVPDIKRFNGGIWLNPPVGSSPKGYKFGLINLSYVIEIQIQVNTSDPDDVYYALKFHYGNNAKSWTKIFFESEKDLYEYHEALAEALEALEVKTEETRKNELKNYFR